jgi:hypothetical protein
MSQTSAKPLSTSERLGGERRRGPCGCGGTVGRSVRLTRAAVKGPSEARETAKGRARQRWPELAERPDLWHRAVRPTDPRIDVFRQGESNASSSGGRRLRRLSIVADALAWESAADQPPDTG